MVQDPDLVARLRDWFAERGVVDERRMFGGTTFLDGGRMSACANSRGALMVRCDPVRTDELCAQEGVEPMVMRGRPMKGWLLVDASVVTDDAALHEWLESALAYARTLPPK
ncbi:TfoX/Sxy family protein [Aeromicrobium sp. Leaf350]|uniref:TfoX/Sxy family protein n=1 Tax=Aeromicrobium sp. Leaf350 TaxID=2876565 RepID=UPI001E4C49FE|nr:TfoX/Sxy family protein [Aeromicrobium sp. Leaf350]